MQKAEPQHGQTQQHQPAAKQGGGAAVASPQGGHTAQLADMIHNSPLQAAQRKKFNSLFGTAQRVTEEEPIQHKLTTAQRATEEEPLQGKFDAAQRVEEDEPIQHKLASDSPAQLAPAEKRPNNTGLPDNLKSGIENLSGMSMDNVKVHYNSSQPAQLNALAYAQGTDIHVAPGQEQHLPHEAWHVVQQAQGRVQPTMQMKEGVPVNDDKGLEHEADVMGGRALRTTGKQEPVPNLLIGSQTIQRVKDYASSGVPGGTGLTPSESGLHGNWHIHVISDSEGEGLGLIDKVFIKFEDRDLYNQHLMFDKDGNMVPTTLSGTGPKELVDWGTQKVKELLAQCTDVSSQEIEKRRQAKVEQEKKQQEALSKLQPIKPSSQHDYSSGSQAGLFGSQDSSIDDDTAIKMMEKAGIDKTNRDFTMIKAKIKNGSPKDKWPDFIQQYYDKIFPPLLTTLSSEIVSQVREHKAPEVEHKAPDIENSSKIAEVVTTSIQQHGNPGMVQSDLMKWGMPIAIIFLIMAIIWQVFA